MENYKLVFGSHNGYAANHDYFPNRCSFICIYGSDPPDFGE